MASKKTSYNKKSNSSNLIFLLPVLAVLAVVPLIVFVYYYDCGLEYYDFFVTEENYFEVNGSKDFFLYYKMVTFTVISAIMAVLLAAKLLIEKGRIKFSKMFIPLGVYALLAFISSVASEYKPYPFDGIYEQFESVWALLGYVLVAYYAFLFINEQRDFNFIIGALLFSTVIMLLIGMSQAFFTDFYQTDLGTSMIVPSDMYKEMVETDQHLTFNFEKGRVYMSLYNPNYVGSYVSLLAPFFMMLVFATKRRYMKVVYGVVFLGLVLVLMGSQSRAGFVGLAVAILLLVVIFNKQLFKNWFPVTAVAIILIGTIYTYNNYTNGLITNKLKSAFSVAESDYDITHLEADDDYIMLTYKGNDVYLDCYYDSSSGYFYPMMYDVLGNQIEVLMDEGMICRPTDERFSSFEITPIQLSEDLIGFDLTISGKSWYFASVDDTYYMITPYGKFIKPRESEYVEWLESHGHFASGRGFIWSRTIPLLKDKILLGSGADTFVLEFPNWDFLALYNGGYDGQIMTKPHNMYLQMAVQTGVLSLVAFLVYYAWFFFSSMAVCFKIRKYSFAAYVGIGCLAGSFGYMVVQIINDSSISVAPIYWTLTGVGIAAFAMVKKEIAAEQEVTLVANKTNKTK